MTNGVFFLCLVDACVLSSPLSVRSNDRGKDGGVEVAEKNNLAVEQKERKRKGVQGSFSSLPLSLSAPRFY